MPNCLVCQMPKSFGICYSRISSLKQYERKYHLFFIHLSLSSQIKYLFLSSLWVTHSLLHPLHSHRLFCSLLFHFALLSFHSWATTNFLSTITQIPSSLIYKISFTDFFFPIFSLSPLCSISYTEATWFGLVHLKAKHYYFVQHLNLLGLYSSVFISLKVLPIHH